MCTLRDWSFLFAFVVVSSMSSACAAWAPNSRAISVEIIGDRGQVYRQFEVNRGGEARTRRAYLEAVPDKPYGIRVRNHTGSRIGLVLAVDGRNIISGERSTLRRHEPMYILGPWQTQTYDGWRTSDTLVHRFFFTDADDSYAGAFGDRSAMGVIAVAAYAEKRPPRPRQQFKEQARGYGGRAPAPSAAGEDTAEPRSEAAAEPGTGFGEGITSRAVRVEFVPERRPLFRQFLKYEWRETLVRMGFMAPPKPANRFWPDFPGPASAPGFAPYPPRFAPPGRRW